MASSGGGVICLQWGWYFPCQSIIRVALERYLFKWSSSRPQIASLLRVMYHSHCIVSPNNTSDQILYTVHYYLSNWLPTSYLHWTLSLETMEITQTRVSNFLVSFVSEIWVKTWIQNGAREVQWDCGPRCCLGKNLPLGQRIFLFLQYWGNLILGCQACQAISRG